MRRFRLLGNLSLRIDKQKYTKNDTDRCIGGRVQFIKSVSLEFVFHLWTTQNSQLWLFSFVSSHALKCEKHRQLARMVQVIVRYEHVSGKPVMS